MADTITQRIVLEGGKDVRSQLTDIGKSGQQAFDSIKQASDKLNIQASVGAIESAAKRAGVSFDDMAKRVQAASSDVAKSATVFKATAQEIDRGTGNVSSFGQAIRQLGRVTGESGISQLGKTAALAGKNLALLAPAAVVAGLEKIASSAASAVEKLNDLAFSAGQTFESFKKVGELAAGSGIGADKFAGVLGKIEEQIKKTEAADDDWSKQVVTNGEARTGAFKSTMTALNQLGVSASSLKFAEPIDKLAILADAFKNFSGTAAQKIDLARQLGIDANLLDQLNKGGDAVREFAASGKLIAPGFQNADKTLSQDFTQSLARLGSALSTLKDQFGLMIAPAFIDFFKMLTETIVENRQGIIEFGQALGSVLKPILEGIGTAIKDVIAPAFGIFKEALDGIAKLVNTVFGSNLTGMQIFTAALVGIGIALATVFSGPTSLIVIAIAMVGKLLAELEKAGPIVDQVSKFFSGMWDGVKAIFAGMAQTVADVWNSIAQGASDIVDGIVGFFQDGIDAVVQFFTDMKDSVLGIFNSILEKAKSVIDAVSQAFSSGSGDAGSGSDQQTPGFARGGLVRGPGTGRSDSILAWLSNREYVINADAVSRVGVGFLDAINGGLQSLMPRRFADGGLVTVAAAGPSGRPIHLHLGGKEFAMSASADVASELQKFAVESNIRSAGRKPRWF